MRRRDFLKIAAAGIGALYLGNTRDVLAKLTGPAPSPDTYPLLQRVIPSSGEFLPAVGLGTWQTFDAGKNAAVREPLSKVLSLFHSKGGCAVDSSPMYGSSEEVTGDLAAGLKLTDKLFFATKVWTRGGQAGIEQMENSLRLFRRKTIDLMQIHNLVEWKVHLETLRKWKEEGKIRYLGITHYTPSSFREVADIMGTEKLDFIQIPYSIALRDAEKKLLPLAIDTKTAVLVNRPFEAGSLFQKVKGLEVPTWAKEAGCLSWSQFFLKYILTNEAVTCVLPATAKVSHLADNMAAGTGRFPSPEERIRMAQFFDSL